MTDLQKYLVYIILWLLIGLIFGVLQKKAKDIESKRNLITLGQIAIIFLMFTMGLCAMSSKLSSRNVLQYALFLFPAGGFVIYLTRQQLFCHKCQEFKSGKSFAEKLINCPKCGEKLS